MFKRKKKQTDIQTPEFRKHTPPPPPPTSGSNASKPPNVGSSVQSPKQPCPYETPCGYCAKWDKKCDKKIGQPTSDPEKEKIIKNIQHLQNLILRDKYSDDVYSTFREDVCRDCMSCNKEPINIVQCVKFKDLMERL